MSMDTQEIPIFFDISGSVYRITLGKIGKKNTRKKTGKILHQKKTKNSDEKMASRNCYVWIPVYAVFGNYGRSFREELASEFSRQCSGKALQVLLILLIVA